MESLSVKGITIGKSNIKLDISGIVSNFTVLQVSPVRAAIGAAESYRSLRKKGLTIRKSNDCLIAFYAIEFSTTLVHSDNDFHLISTHSKLKTWKEVS